jgi:hypothetical protein
MSRGAIGAITREVATKDKFLMRQEVFWCGRLGDGELGRVDVLGPTSQRRAERCYRRTEGATGQGREQS